MFQTSFTRQPRTFAAVLEGIERPPIVSNKKLQAEFNARVITNLIALVEALRAIGLNIFGCDFEDVPGPMTDAFDMAKENAPEIILQNIRDYIRRIDKTIKKYEYFGTVEYTGRDTCSFRYCDSTKTHRLLETDYHNTQHEHHLVDVHERRLDEVPLRPEQSRIVSMLPEFILPHVRIVTGTVNLMKEQFLDTETQANALTRGIVKTASGLSRFISRNQNAVVGAASLGALACFGGWAYSAMTAVAVVAVVDPAIVIGDLVVSGWLEE